MNEATFASQDSYELAREPVRQVEILFAGALLFVTELKCDNKPLASWRIVVSKQLNLGLVDAPVVSFESVNVRHPTLRYGIEFTLLTCHGLIHTGFFFSFLFAYTELNI